MSADLKLRFTPIFRRSSTAPPAQSPSSTSPSAELPPRDRKPNRTTNRLSKAQRHPSVASVQEESDLGIQCTSAAPTIQRQEGFGHPQEAHHSDPVTPQENKGRLQNPRVIIERPTPERGRSSEPSEAVDPSDLAGRLAEPSVSAKRANKQSLAARRHSPIHNDSSRLFSALYRIEEPIHRPSYTRQLTPVSHDIKMPYKKVWVKRAGSSPTQVSVGEDDLVDDVRDMVIRKYANSLGRNYDSPDVNLRLVQRKYSARHSNHERSLGPEEAISKIIDLYYPGGQTIEEALLIDVPQRRTPKHSPRLALPYYMTDSLRPGENGSDYFPPMALAGPHSPQIPSNLSAASNQSGVHRAPTHSIAVLETGQLPDLPSPGSRMTRHSHRPRNTRTHTTSPTVMSGAANNSTHENLKAPTSQPVHTPPVSGIAPEHTPHQNITPPPRTSSPRLPKNNKRNRKAPPEKPLGTSPSTLLDNAVPPINVLIVEDNIINLRLLEAFLKRLKVRWSTAMNGKDAVTSWRKGGFHLVLMDIQLPVMNGLDATKEIRRLERVNDIGIFTNSAGSTPTISPEEKSKEEANLSERQAGDTLDNIALFKSSVIIVALTASSLQSDRHEALAAGCNDFLTKPVSFDWLSRKVMEWGCMQALIDFDGWRKWKDLSSSTSSPLKKDLVKNNTSAFASKNTQDSTISPSTSNTGNNASKLAHSPTTSKSGKSVAAAATAPAAPAAANGSASPMPASGGSKSRKSPQLNGLSKDKPRGISTSDEVETETGTDTGTGTDTNGEEGSGAEIVVGA